MPRSREALFWTGTPDRSGMRAYVHVIRSPTDPPETKPRGGGRRGAGWETKVGPASEWRERLLEHMADEEPRTFNRVCVELTGATADVLLGSTLDEALWQLVAERRIAFTLVAPIQFVLATRFEAHGRVAIATGSRKRGRP